MSFNNKIKNNKISKNNEKRSIFFKIPTYFTRKKGGAQYIELFFDIIIIAAIGSFVHVLSNNFFHHEVHHGKILVDYDYNINKSQIFFIATQILTIMLLWKNQTDFNNKMGSETARHIFITLGIIFFTLFIILAAYVSQSSHKTIFTLMSIGLSGIFILTIYQYAMVLDCFKTQIWKKISILTTYRKSYGGIIYDNSFFFMGFI
ncbi:MAG: hypothetical protein K4H23_05355 [Mollicutes bacterium PWAP]|nr:hypothetical protein [Mollicutes bacterium PWAP]